MHVFDQINAQLEAAIRRDTPAQRAEMIEKVLNLFVDSPESLSEEQIELFGDILCRLVAEIEIATRVRLSTQLIDVARAPSSLIKLLALDDEIAVAEPLLVNFEPMQEGVLIECVTTKSQDHLMAVSRRRTLSENVTDILVERGDEPVLYSVVANQGSRFSKGGYETLVRRANGNDEISLCIGSRIDLPRHIFLKILAVASDTVREKLEKLDPQNAVFIRRIVSQVASDIASRSAMISTDYSDALREMRTMFQVGLFDLKIFNNIIYNKNITKLICALSIIASYDVALVESAFNKENNEELVLICRAIELEWNVAKSIIYIATESRRGVTSDFDRELAYFMRIQPETARQILAFQGRKHKMDQRAVDIERPQGSC
ncbi:MAG: DUF2336 domain-containing protein [Calothrix sp. SM1_5_4]|nr:DUF2336 domain-containing protein [Calothrix sp. SM1_5_4]